MADHRTVKLISVEDSDKAVKLMLETNSYVDQDGMPYEPTTPPEVPGHDDDV